VGKAWRTTEKMLEEDFLAIARGDNPADLPMPGTAIPARDVKVPKRGRKKPEGEPAPAPEPKKKAKAKRPAAKPRKTEKPDDGDDTQQLLF